MSNSGKDQGNTLAGKDNVSVKAMMYTSIPAFPKFSLCHFTFTKDLHEYLFLLTETNLKMIFTYRKKVKNEKQVFSSCFQQAVREAVYTRGRVGTAKLQTAGASQHQTVTALHCV